MIFMVNIRNLLGIRKTRKKTKMSLRTISLLSFASGSLLALTVFFVLELPSQIEAFLNLIAAFLILGLPLVYKYNEYRRIKRIETLFPKYLRDISENISTGMTLPQAMKAATRNEYQDLTPHVKELYAKVQWGVPLEHVLEDFSKRTGSKTMRRNVQTIIEAHRSGGTIDTILKSVASSLQELERIKKERSSSIYAQMINGYLIYIVFLGVMIGLATILVPAFTRFGSSSADLQAAFIEIFRSLTVIQGFFAGIAIGKMAEGTIVAGVKHALALVIFGYSVFLIFG